MNRRLFFTSLVLGPAALQIALKAKETGALRPVVFKPYARYLPAYGSRIDADSLAILPPVIYPVGRPVSRWGHSYHFVHRLPS